MTPLSKTLNLAPRLWVPAVRLGQAIRTAGLNISVTDAKGYPFAGARISSPEIPGEAITDAHGIASLPVQENAIIRVEAGPFVTSRQAPPGAASRGETLFVQIPVCAPVPFLTTAEIAGTLGGAAIAGAGFLWKIEPLQILGEILLGASAFTAIYRHSCPAG